MPQIQTSFDNMPLPVKFDSINKKFPPMFELKKGLTFESSWSTCTPSTVL